MYNIAIKTKRFQCPIADLLSKKLKMVRCLPEDSTTKLSHKYCNN